MSELENDVVGLLVAKNYQKAAELGPDIYPILGGFLWHTPKLIPERLDISVIDVVRVMVKLQMRGHPVPEQQLFALVKVSYQPDLYQPREEVLHVLEQAGSDAIRPLLAGIRNGNHSIASSCAVVVSRFAGKFDVSDALPYLEQALLRLTNEFRVLGSGVHENFMQKPENNQAVLRSILLIAGAIASLQPERLSREVALQLIEMCCPRYKDIHSEYRARALANGAMLGKQLSEHFGDILTQKMLTPPDPNPRVAALNAQMIPFLNQLLTDTELGILVLLKNEKVPVSSNLAQILYRRLPALNLSQVPSEADLLVNALKRGGIENADDLVNFVRADADWDIRVIKESPVRFRELAEWYVANSPDDAKVAAKRVVVVRYDSASKAFGTTERQMDENPDALKRFKAPTKEPGNGVFKVTRRLPT